jgi:hypothetical protein
MAAEIIKGFSYATIAQKAYKKGTKSRLRQYRKSYGK